MSPNVDVSELILAPDGGARGIRPDADDARSSALATLARGRALIALGHFNEAVDQLRVVATLSRMDGYVGLQYEAELLIATVLRATGDVRGALRELGELLPLVAERHDGAQELAVRTHLYEIYKSLGRFERALDHHEHIMRLRSRSAEAFG
jgi:tetratricopeptide (TPR) repeat protein